MKPNIEGMSREDEVESRSRDLFNKSRSDLFSNTDRLFIYIMLLQWIGAMLAAWLIAPWAWAGATRSPHIHVWAGLFLGGLIVAPPIGLAIVLPGRIVTRHVIAIAQLAMGGLLIHLTGGRIETHFHIFGSLAFLAFYRDWPVLLSATLVVVLDHGLRGMFWPQSIYGVASAPIWRTFEHAGWVIFEDIVLIGSCVEGSRELLGAAKKQAQLEVTREGIEQTVALRTKELQASETRQRAILESALDGIVSIDPQGIVLEFNPAAETIFGYRRADVLGRDLTEVIIPQSMRAAHKAGIARHIATGDSRILNTRIELPAMRADGVEIPLEVAITSAKDSNGETTYTAFIRDIGERKRAEETLLKRSRDLEAAQSQLTAAAEFAVALNQTDVQSTYDSALRCVARVLRSPLAVAFASNGEGALKPKTAVAIDERSLNAKIFSGEGLPASVFSTGEIQTIEGPFQDSSLQLRVGVGDASIQQIIGWPIIFNNRRVGALTTAHVSPLSDEQRAFVVACLDQLAIRMNAFQVEEQRLRLFADLQEQSRDLELSRREAERASRVKSEFLANMSHELRTPMNSIMGFTQRLIRKLGPNLQERELDALKTVDRNAKHLLGLINNILDLSKIEAGKMELNLPRFDLVASTKEVVEQSAALVDNKPIEIRIDLPDRPVHFDGDFIRIKQVLTNLLSNGIKYTERGSVTVSVRETFDDQLGRVARISFRDTGVGIKFEDRSRLFQHFTQLDGTPSRKVGGTGLGLVITDQYVKMHHGRIDVESEYGQGSDFTIVLPLDPVPASPPTGHADLSASNRVKGSTDLIATSRPFKARDGDRNGGGIAKPHLEKFFVPEPNEGGLMILCVDDEPDVLKYLRLTFEDAGYDVMEAGDHDTAIQNARRRPDLICLDLSMPEKDGFDILKSLRADPDLIDVPVLVVSASAEQARSLKAGARRCLTKPVGAEDLVSTVRDLLAREIGSALIVEDNPDTSKLLSETLMEHGVLVRTAFNGREALERLAESIPSVIVLDLMMPVMNGFSFLSEIQDDPVLGRIPIVILTAKTLDSDEVNRLRSIGAPILTKGRGDTERLVDMILKAALPRRRRNVSEEATV